MRSLIILSLVSVLFYQSAFSHSLKKTGLIILTADQTSGYILPVHAFEHHCEITDDGQLTGHLNSNRSHGGWAISQDIERTLTDEELAQLNSLLTTAKEGPFQRRNDVE